MIVSPARGPGRESPISGFVVVLAAALVAVVSARDYAGSWNDGSRLATVECLVDYHTLVIDRSIFVQVPPATEPAGSPYPADDLLLQTHGTGDKLFIDGHFYSDKSPVPALLMAGLYQGLQWSTGLVARERPDRFCYWMTLGSSGLAYIVAVWCTYGLGRTLQLARSLRLLLTASFALATVALPYVRHVNNHILLLGIAALLLLGLASLATRCEASASASPRPRVPASLLLGLGTLAGAGYTVDLGAGPVLLACTLALVAYRCRRFQSVVWFALAALPWLLLHHAVNYAIGGTIQPANAVAEYFLWPGSSFNPQNLTGAWNHSFGHFLTYAAALLAGKRGFLGHNLPLFLTVLALVVLLRRRTAEFPELIFAGCWSAGTWLVYALTSTNYSGLCCSIRWFVPLLAPGYYVLAIFLREYPRYRGDFLVLSGWGALMAGIMWWHGPWIKHMMPLFWPFVAAGLLSWLLYGAGRRRQKSSVSLSVADEPNHRANAA